MPESLADKTCAIAFGVTASQSLALLGDLPLQMIRRGWGVSVICGTEHEGHELWEGKVRVTKIPMKRKPAPMHDVVAFFQWVWFLSRSKPMILAVATPKASLIGLLAAKVCGVPNRVYLLWGLRLETATGISLRILYWLEKLSAICSTTIFSVSKSLSQAYASLGLAPAGKIKVVGAGSSHGVNLTRFTNRTKSKRDLRDLVPTLDLETPTLGFVGRFCIDKGAETLLAMAKYLSSRGHIFQLLVVGPIEDSGELISEIGCYCQAVVAIGETEDVAPYYGLMDVLLLPTKREGFPNVVLEASASGIPTVTTAVTGAVDAVMHMETGLVSSIDSSLDFAKCVERLLDNSALRAELGKNAQRWVSLNFMESIVGQQYVSALESLCNKPIGGK